MSGGKNYSNEIVRQYEIFCAQYKNPCAYSAEVTPNFNENRGIDATENNRFMNNLNQPFNSQMTTSSGNESLIRQYYQSMDPNIGNGLNFVENESNQYDIDTSCQNRVYSSDKNITNKSVRFLEEPESPIHQDEVVFEDHEYNDIQPEEEEKEVKNTTAAKKSHPTTRSKNKRKNRKLTTKKKSKNKRQNDSDSEKQDNCLSEEDMEILYQIRDDISKPDNHPDHQFIRDPSYRCIQKIIREKGEDVEETELFVDCGHVVRLNMRIQFYVDPRLARIINLKRGNLREINDSVTDFFMENIYSPQSAITNNEDVILFKRLLKILNMTNSELKTGFDDNCENKGSNESDKYDGDLMLILNLSPYKDDPEIKFVKHYSYLISQKPFPDEKDMPQNIGDKSVSSGNDFDMHELEAAIMEVEDRKREAQGNMKDHYGNFYELNSTDLSNCEINDSTQASRKNSRKLTTKGQKKFNFNDFCSSSSSDESDQQ